MEIIVLSYLNTFNLNIFEEKMHDGNVLSDPPHGEKMHDGTIQRQCTLHHNPFRFHF